MTNYSTYYSNWDTWVNYDYGGGDIYQKTKLVFKEPYGQTSKPTKQMGLFEDVPEAFTPEEIAYFQLYECEIISADHVRVNLFKERKRVQIKKVREPDGRIHYDCSKMSGPYATSVPKTVRRFNTVQNYVKKYLTL